MLINILLVVHLIATVSIIVLVLLQQGKGADMGAAFGGGSSGALFGARGGSNFLSHTTAILAAVFFLTSLVLAYLYAQQSSRTSVTQDVIYEAPLIDENTSNEGGDIPSVDGVVPDAETSEGDVPAVPSAESSTDEAAPAPATPEQ
ncbi:MAG: preprotein translocase subunit SecG [Arenicellales bacterium WSBS_2016_MAG_OTU3]